MTMIVIAIVLVYLSSDRANSRTCRTANQGSLHAAAEDRSQRSAASSSDQSTLPRPNSPAMVIIMVIVA
jgi:hypothetical protein